MVAVAYADRRRSHTSAGLEVLLGEPAAGRLRASLEKQPFRRITDVPEQAVDVSRLCQMVHVDVHADQRCLALGDEVTPYYVNNLDASLQEIHHLLDLGIRRVYLQAVPSATGHSPEERLDAMTATVLAIQHEFRGSVELMVDPQALCMRPDLRWGMTGAGGQVDPEQTLVLLGGAVERFAQLDVFGVMTIGRINGEAEVARAALTAAGTATRLYAFSTNSETPTAYFERTGGDPRRAITGQKILVGNSVEMVLRTLADAAEGIDGMLQKPLENVHVLSVLASLVEGTLSIDQYLGSDAVQELFAAHPQLVERFAYLAPELLRRVDIGALRLGAYEVSGTFSLRVLLRERFGEAIAWSVAQEAYLTTLAAGGSSFEMIVGRGMSSFVATGKRLGLA